MSELEPRYSHQKAQEPPFFIYQQWQTWDVWGSGVKQNCAESYEIFVAKIGYFKSTLEGTLSCFIEHNTFVEQMPPKCPILLC